jgi:hypothetical protein
MSTRLPTLPTISVSRQRLWRCVPKIFTSTVLESGPSFTKDRRYSIQGEFGAVYFSGSKDLAELEADERVGLDAEPMAYLEFELTVHQLVDLRSPKIRGYFGAPLEQLVKSRIASDRYVTTQTIARKIYTAKLRGLLVPSVHDPEGQKAGWFNVVLYPAHLMQSCLRAVRTG